jgi:RNA polymerase sigma-70 factor (ECF subfamily)
VGRALAAAALVACAPREARDTLAEGRDVDEEAAGELAMVSRIDGADPLDVVRRRELAARLQAALDYLRRGA